MIGILYSSIDIASKNAIEYMIREHGLEEKRRNGLECFTDGKVLAYRVGHELVHTDVADTLGLDIVCFASRHRSAAGRAAFTTHSLGNWSSEARFGGMPKQLATSAPAAMLSVMEGFSKSGIGIEKTYEATHHGPLTKIPALFAEFGGNEDTIQSVEVARNFAEGLYSTISRINEGKIDYAKAVIGVGGTHYPEKFSRLAMEKRYAFGHIMPRHAIINNDGTDNIEMLGQAVERSNAKVDTAVIEWKSMNAATRDKVIKRIDEMGIGYERV